MGGQDGGPEGGRTTMEGLAAALGLNLADRRLRLTLELAQELTGSPASSARIPAASC